MAEPDLVALLKTSQGVAVGMSSPFGTIGGLQLDHLHRRSTKCVPAGRCKSPSPRSPAASASEPTSFEPAPVQPNSSRAHVVDFLSVRWFVGRAQSFAGLLGACRCRAAIAQYPIGRGDDGRVAEPLSDLSKAFSRGSRFTVFSTKGVHCFQSFKGARLRLNIIQGIGDFERVAQNNFLPASPIPW